MLEIEDKYIKGIDEIKMIFKLIFFNNLIDIKSEKISNNRDKIVEIIVENINDFIIKLRLLVLPLLINLQMLKDKEKEEIVINKLIVGKLNVKRLNVSINNILDK